MKILRVVSMVVPSSLSQSAASMVTRLGRTDKASIRSASAKLPMSGRFWFRTRHLSSRRRAKPPPEEAGGAVGFSEMSRDAL